ncbi:IS701 family transposase [Streptosporangium sp. NBC_01756]|nr:IS701 family transposase [Streptosporangium sp. NBC_01756]WSC87883.1 IS701 family transposase [Streptosporangium sp. NBC_01756]
MEEVRPRLEAFAAEMLGSLPRRDQRAKGELYVRGLMLDGKHKSMQPMAEHLGVDHQQLQQFVSSSTWDYAKVRERLARWAAAHIAPEAYAIDDVGFPKDGYDSPGVARMYCGALGKRGNCQIGVSVNLVSDRASCAVDWRLFLPESWDDAKHGEDALLAGAIRRRRAKAAIPQAARHREKWRLALDMLDEVRGTWELPDLPVVADAGYGDATGFREGLTERALTYAVAVKATTTAYPGDASPERPPYSGQGRPAVSAYPHPHTTLRALALAAGQAATRTVTWRQGSKATKRNPNADLRSQFLSLRVRPANRSIRRSADGALPECRLLIEWPPDCAEPTDYWLSTLPADTPLRELARIAKIRWRVEHDYRELKDGLGLDHFEGRSYLGWHRHVTLASLAQAFCTLLRLNPKAPAPA